MDCCGCQMGLHNTIEANACLFDVIGIKLLLYCLIGNDQLN